MRIVVLRWATLAVGISALSVAALTSCVGDSGDTTAQSQDAGPSDASMDTTTATADGGGSSDAQSTDAGTSTDGSVADADASRCVFPAGAAAGTLDPNFQAQFYPNMWNGTSVSVDSSGSIYVVGWDPPTNGNCSVAGQTTAYAAKMKNTGEVDQSFGTNGHLCVNADTAQSNDLQASAIDPDGTLVATGFEYSQSDASATSAQTLIVRITPQGAFDNGFGTGGRVLFHGIPGGGSVAYALALDTSVSPAKIVVAGANFYLFGPNPPATSWVMRFNHNGTPDIGFNGGNPVVDTAVVNGYFGVTVVNGAIYVAGGAGTTYTMQKAAVRRLKNDGSFDSAFGGGNPVLVPLGPNDDGQGDGVVPLPSGGVAVAGSSIAHPDLGGTLTVGGITSTGASMSTFGDAGATGLTLNGQGLIYSYAYQFGAMSADCEGRLLLSTTAILDASPGPPETYNEAAIARVLPNGALDTTFGTGGFGLANGFNSSSASAPVEDPKTGGILVILRRRGGQDAQVGLIRLAR
jgi:uncharacterized delta-60 repeat protein